MLTATDECAYRRNLISTVFDRMCIEKKSGSSLMVHVSMTWHHFDRGDDSARILGIVFPRLNSELDLYDKLRAKYQDL